MQYRVYQRQTLDYVDGGYVQSYEIDDDYIVNNNSVIYVTKKQSEADYALNEVVAGDIIVLIETSGAFHKGVITAVDETDLSISYKSDKELFNDDMPNIFVEDFTADEDLTAIDTNTALIVSVLAHYFSSEKVTDPYKGLPLTFVLDGDADFLWKWSDDSINIVDWLTELFEDYNISVGWTIDFDLSAEEFEERSPKYVVTVSSVANEKGIIKDNVAMQTITYTSYETPDATVCRILNESDKSFQTDDDGEVVSWYLYEYTDDAGEYFVNTSPSITEYEGLAVQRVLPVKTVIATYDDEDDDGDTTYQDVAEDELIPSKFNQAIEIQINSDSKMFDFENAQFGDLYTIVNEYGTINSIYTGRKMNNSEKWVTLYFGLGRQNYTDIIQIKLRKQRYTTVYNLTKG